MLWRWPQQPLQPQQSFALRLRDGVHPDLVAEDLLQVVDLMVEPTQTSLWMRRP